MSISRNLKVLELTSRFSHGTDLNGVQFVSKVIADAEQVSLVDVFFLDGGQDQSHVVVAVALVRNRRIYNSKFQRDFSNIHGHGECSVSEQKFVDHTTCCPIRGSNP